MDSDAFADGKKVAIKEDVSFFKIISEGAGKMGTLLKTGEIEESTYLESTEPIEIFHVPGLVTGSVEAATRAVTDITGIVVLVYDLSVNEQARKQTWQGLKKVKDQIVEDPSTFFPILTEIIVDEATGNSPEDWAEITHVETDFGKKSHLITKGAVRTSMTIFTGGKFILKLPELADGVAAKMLDAKLIVKFKKAKGFDENLLKVFRKDLNELLEELPEAIESITKISDFTSAKELTDLVAKMNTLKEVPGLDKVTTDMVTQWNKFHGGQFVLDYFSSKIDNLDGRLRFEVKEAITNVNGDAVARVYDGILEGGGKVTKYELKNWSGWYPETIRTQFIRDLQGINSLEELKWVYNSTSGVNKSNLKDKILETLKKADGSAVDELENLFNKNQNFRNKVSEWIGNERNVDGEGFLKWLSKDDNFNKIFEIIN